MEEVQRWADRMSAVLEVQIGALLAQGCQCEVCAGVKMGGIASALARHFATTIYGGTSNPFEEIKEEAIRLLCANLDEEHLSYEAGKRANAPTTDTKQ
jgi:hypothetical protein